MPSAASGSENPRPKTARKAPAAGPKRTPRPESTNGKGSPSAKKGTVSPSEEPPQKSEPSSRSGEAEAPEANTSATVTDTVPTATAPVVTDPTVVEPAPSVPEPPVERRSRPRPPESDAADKGRRKGRRVRRVIRRIDLWSVMKLAIVLYTCLYAAVMATLALLWGLAYSSGQIEKVQSFMADVGMDNYRFYGDQMWRACAMIGAIGVLAATIITVLTAALINVISEMTGGIRVVVIEEDPPPRRR